MTRSSSATRTFGFNIVSGIHSSCSNIAPSHSAEIGDRRTVGHLLFAGSPPRYAHIPNDTLCLGGYGTLARYLPEAARRLPAKTSDLACSLPDNEPDLYLQKRGRVAVESLTWRILDA